MATQDGSSMRYVLAVQPPFTKMTRSFTVGTIYCNITAGTALLAKGIIIIAAKMQTTGYLIS